MTPEQLQELKRQGYNRIPVTRTVLADFDTPLSTYLKLADGRYSCLLESVEGGEKWGRYSFIGLGSRQVVRVTGNRWSLECDGTVTEERTVADPLAEVERFRAQFKVPELPGLPRFHGGLVGYFSYDTVRYIEARLGASSHPDPLATPDIMLMVIDDLVVFDNLTGKVIFVTHVTPDEPDALKQAEATIDSRIAALHSQKATLDSGGTVGKEPEFAWSEEGFKRAVDTVRDYILAGDVMQVVLSQRITLPFEAHPLNLYRALRFLNPSPYMFYLNLGSFHVVGSSPEILARMEGDEVVVRPLAGTRKRGATPEQDEQLQKELLADPKERAEHLMLIDLGRNDIGRIAAAGTVAVTEQMAVERYSHVMHIVSQVIGQVRPGLNAMDVLRATLPAGTLSGAPKVRAMEIIDELEPIKRGIYGGAIGYLAWNGYMDTAIAIRTAVIRNGQLTIQAGAGVVADSVPELEWQETLNKAGALLQAAQSVRKGL